MRKKTCRHGLELRPAKAIPPRMQGCVICHNLPTTGNWHPWCWPLKSYTHEEVMEILQDLDEVLVQREVFRRKLEGDSAR